LSPSCCWQFLVIVDMSGRPTLTEQPSKVSEGIPSPILVFENVSLAFDEKVVLEDISFRLERGETKAIFGVAGSGKSTILSLQWVC
jgi:ABC-type multidrug transport system fused ATPase/permease subunit